MQIEIHGPVVAYPYQCNEALIRLPLEEFFKQGFEEMAHYQREEMRREFTKILLEALENKAGDNQAADKLHPSCGLTEGYNE